MIVEGGMITWVELLGRGRYAQTGPRLSALVQPLTAIWQVCEDCEEGRGCNCLPCEPAPESMDQVRLKVTPFPAALYILENSF